MEDSMVEGDNSPGKSTHVLVQLDPIEWNTYPDALHIYARHYYKCKQDFKPPDDYFSPIPYFLLCRAIELEIKAKLTKRLPQSAVKKKFGHHLVKAYKALDAPEQVLSQSDIAVLITADELYRKTDLAYFNPVHMLTAFSQFPDLETLDTVAKKLVDAGSTTWE
jgi:hypothetical protein